MGAALIRYYTNLELPHPPIVVELVRRDIVAAARGGLAAAADGVW